MVACSVISRLTFLAAASKTLRAGHMERAFNTNRERICEGRWSSYKARNFYQKKSHREEAHQRISQCDMTEVKNTSSRNWLVLFLFGVH